MAAVPPEMTRYLRARGFAPVYGGPPWLELILPRRQILVYVLTPEVIVNLRIYDRPRYLGRAIPVSTLEELELAVTFFSLAQPNDLGW